MHPRAIYQVALSRLREFMREPVALFWVYGFPQVILLTLGFAFTDRPPQQLHVDVIAEKLTPSQQQDVLSIFTADDRILAAQRSLASSQERLRRVRTSAFVLAEPDATARGHFTYTIHYDPARLDSALAQAILEALLLKSSPGSPRVISRVWQQLGARYVDFMVPGLLAVGVMGGSLVAIGYTLVEMRLRKLLRVYLSTPLQPHDLFLGLMASRLALLIPESLSVLLAAQWLFDVRVAGHGLLLVLILGLGALAFMGIGLLIGSRGHTLEQASGWVSVLMLVQWVFSGVFFSRHVYPESWQPVLRVLPLTALVDAVRGVMSNGDTLFQLFDALLILLIWTVIAFPLALWRFRWE